MFEGEGFGLEWMLCGRVGSLKCTLPVKVDKLKEGTAADKDVAHTRSLFGDIAI